MKASIMMGLEDTGSSWNYLTTTAIQFTI